MLVHSDKFKSAIGEFGRQINAKVSVYDELILATQNDNILTTESGLEIISKSSSETVAYELTGENIRQLKIVTKGEILHTLMKEIDFESELNLDVGGVVRFRFGVFIEEDNDYEYLDYGKYIIYKKEKNQDTDTYTYTCYDYMLKTMVKVTEEFKISYKNYKYAESDGSGNYNIQLRGVLEIICDILGLEVDLELSDENNKFRPIYFAYMSRFIDIEALKKSCVTYRDVLDALCQYSAINMYTFNNELLFKNLGTIEERKVGDTLKWWYLELENPTPVDEFDEDFLKDKNTGMGSLYGPINTVSVVLDTEENYIASDSESVEKNGITEYKLNNNYPYTFQGVNIEGDLQEILKKINGVSYNVIDISTIGICYLEWLDYFNITVKGNTYKCLLLNSEITIKNGISEDIYNEEPENNLGEYITGSSVSNDTASNLLKSVENMKTYSTTKEVPIGKWIDGKTIYRRTVTGPTFSANESYQTFSFYLNADTLINHIEYIGDTQQVFLPNTYDPEIYIYTKIEKENDGWINILTRRANANYWAGWTLTVTFEYTKN